MFLIKEYNRILNNIKKNKTVIYFETNKSDMEIYYNNILNLYKTDLYNMIDHNIQNYTEMKFIYIEILNICIDLLLIEYKSYDELCYLLKLNYESNNTYYYRCFNINIIKNIYDCLNKILDYDINNLIKTCNLCITGLILLY